MATATNPAKRAPAKKTTTAAKAAPAKKAARPAAAVKAAAKPAKAARAPESEIASGWYKDPADPTSLRYWDGEGWLGAPLPEGIVTGTVQAAEVEPDGEESTAKPATITWLGREMVVERPDPGMVAVWTLTAKQYARANVDRMTPQEAVKASGRLVQVVLSVLADPDDQEWVQDLLLARTIKLDDITAIMTLTNDAYEAMAAQDGNRETRRAASKARRR